MGDRLETLIPEYNNDKKELDKIKKKCDANNLVIKELMLEQDITEYKVDNLIAKYVVATKESFNEPKLIEVLKSAGYMDCVKTKEYVDMEILESALYHSEIDADTIVKIDSCKEKHETIQLRITERK